jgi:hypothetical protein
MKISKFKFFHGKVVRDIDDFYNEFFRIYDDPTLPTLNDTRTITSNLDLDIFRISNTINRRMRTPELIINGQNWEIRY